MNNFASFLVSLLSLSASLVLANPSACCPDNYVTLEGRCFFIATDVYNGLAPPRNATVSRDLCISFMQDSDTWKTDLASLDVDLLTAFSLHIVNNIPDMKSYIFWVGAQKVDGVWQWTDGSPINNLSYIWYMPSPMTSVVENIGMLVPAGAYNRFYMKEYPDFAQGPSFLCEAKKK